MSDFLRPNESQHARPPCPSPTPGVHPDSRPSSQWCHPAISSSVVPTPPAPNPSQHQSLFQWVNSLHEVAKVLEFQLQHPSKEIPGLISFRMDQLDLLAVQGTSPTPQFKGINYLALSLFYCPALTLYMTTGKTIALTRGNFIGKIISLFFNTLSRFVIPCLLRSKHLFISWLQLRL